MSGTIAITGATGFIGRHLIHSLIAAGRPLRALSRRPDRADLPGDVAVVGGSLEDAAALARLVEGAEAVVHCAGLIKAATGRDLHRVNAAGTSSLAKVCADMPVPPRMIFLSSLAARHPEVSDYAASKRQAEQELAAQGSALDWTILRPPAVYGPGDRETLQLFRLLPHGFLPTPRTASARFSLIFIDDLCDAVLALLSGSAPRTATFEIRDLNETGYSWRQVAEASGRFLDRAVTCLPVPRAVMGAAAIIDERLARITGRAPRLTPGKVRELFHEDWVCRDNPLVRHTDWRPKVGLDEGIARTLGWYLKRGWI